MKKDFLKFVGIGLLAFQLVSHQTANAAIVDNGTYTTDTTSGLDWLDLRESINKSYFTVGGLFDPGEQYAGWMFATETQLNTLLTNYTGFASASEINSSTDPNLLDNLISMLGRTYTGADANVYGLRGILSDTFASDSGRRTLKILQRNAFNEPEYATTSIDNDDVDGIVGSFLVRVTAYNPTVVTAVPEPQTYAMFLAGVMLLGFSVSRRKS